MGLWVDLKAVWINTWIEDPTFGTNRYNIVDDYMKFKAGKKVIFTTQDKCTLAKFYKGKLVILGEDSRISLVDNKETLKLIIKIFIDAIKIYDFNLVEFIKKYKVPNQYFVIGDQKFYMKGTSYYLIASSEADFFVTILEALRTNFDFKFEEHDILLGYIA